MGPIGVKQHLSPFLAGHSFMDNTSSAGDSGAHGAVSAAPWGSSGILPISWMYIAMMGAEGLLKATQIAILSANYIATKLSSHYRILYTGRNGRVAHECIIDLRPLKQTSGISEEDIAKRLMDFGFHAPTMSFPVAGTLMIEPTESESKQELDRFIASMIVIRQEIAQVEAGEIDAEDNPLKNAPHTLADMMDETWNRPYSKMKAAYPWIDTGKTELKPRNRITGDGSATDTNSLSNAVGNKYWPSVNRIDNVYGDRNLHCACPSIDSYK